MPEQSRATCFAGQSVSCPALRRACSGLVFFTVALLIAAATLAEDTLPARQQALADMQAAVQQLQGELQRKRGRQAAKVRKFSEAEKTIGELAQKKYRLEQQQKTIAKQVALLEKELAEISRSQQLQQEEIARYLRAAYIHGKADALALLLDSKSPADISRQLYYLQSVNRARSELINSYSALLERKLRVASTLQDRQNENQRNQRELAGQQQKLAQAQQQRAVLLARLEKDIAKDDARLSDLRNSAAELQKLVDTMSRSFTKKPGEAASAAQPLVLPGSFASARGKLPWPVSGKQRSTYGAEDKLSGVVSRGISIRARPGEEVRSIYPGEVIFADWFGGQGLLAIIDHGDGFWSLYGHNQSLLKPVGTQVSAGEPIATVGNSGGRSEPAVYFEIRRNGVPDNPANWCR